MQCQSIRLIVSIVFLLIDAIDSVNNINRIDPGVLNCSAMQLKDISNEPTDFRITFWGKNGEIFEVTGIYWHLQIFNKVCLRNK